MQDDRNVEELDIILDRGAEIQDGEFRRVVCLTLKRILGRQSTICEAQEQFVSDTEEDKKKTQQALNDRLLAIEISLAKVTTGTKSPIIWRRRLRRFC